MRTHHFPVKLFLAFLVFISIQCKAQKKDEISHRKIEAGYTEQEFNAYNMNSVSMWKNIVENYKNDLLELPGDTFKLFQLVRAQYGLLNSCIGNQDQETFSGYTDETEENIKELMEMNVNLSELYAIQAGIYSLKIAFDPGKGMTFGPKSGKAINKALNIDKEEPTAWLQQAGSKLHTPKQFGGSVTEAIDCYIKSIELFEKTESALKYNWQYVSALVWLGIAYNTTEQYEESEKIFNKVLLTAPDHGWVKYSLLPQTKSKSKIQL